MSREERIVRVTLVGSVVNLLLVGLKAVAGIVGHSAAMVSDAVHSLSDLLTDAAFGPKETFCRRELLRLRPFPTSCCGISTKR